MATSFSFPHRETYMEKGWRKCKEQPLVPIGIFATCVALIGATKHLRAGDRTNFNRFLRFRVLAQGITVAACVGGTLVYGHYNKQEKDSERLREEAELATYHAAKDSAEGPLGPPPTTAAQRRTEESIEELVARAEALERAQARGSNARDTLMAALMKQKAEKAEWARQKEQAAAENNVLNELIVYFEDHVSARPHLSDHMSPNLAPNYPYPSWDFTDKESFAYTTVVKRWPIIITNLIDTLYRAVDAEGNANPEKVAEGKALISRLSKLKYDMSHDRPLEEIPKDGGFNSKVYNDRLQDLANSGNNTWMKIPWLFGECYLYRLFDSILRATRHWSTFDPFFQQKEDTFRESGAAVHQIAQLMADLEDRRREFQQESPGWEDKLAILFAEMVQMCLWGNATDLSLLPSMDPADVALLQAVGEDKAHLILRNDAGVLWKHIRSLRDTRIDFVLDNGFELFTDLVFADFLITFTPYASSAVFHPKPIPWFVSDVTPRDWDAIFHALKDPSFFTTLDPSMTHRESLKRMVKRWETYVQTGVFTLGPEEAYGFWVAPGGFWEMAPGRDGEVGDLNYRKLTGDIKWPNSTPWEEAIGPLAGRFPLLSLRTCKADVVVGLEPGVAERLDADPKEKGWRASGKYGLITFSK